MREKVGSCVRCNADLFCDNGFFQGVVLEDGKSICFDCAEKENAGSDRNDGQKCDLPRKDN
jgi:hypothetical protein